MNVIADHAAVLLRDHVVDPLRAHAVDRLHGGFLVDLDHAWQPSGPHHKTLEHAARTTLALAIVDAAIPSWDLADLVLHGARFVDEAMWDHEDGGFFACVNRAGAPRWDGLKHPHGCTYAIRALLLADRLAPDDRFRRRAREGLAWLQDVCWDEQLGTYRGTFRRDGTAYRPDEPLPTDTGNDPLGDRAGSVEVNTLGDAVPLHVAAIANGIGERNRLERLVHELRARILPSGGLPYRYLPDWTPAPEPLRVGHQLQSVRRLLEAGEVLGDQGGCLDDARRLARHADGRCRHPAGGFPSRATDNGWCWAFSGAPADARELWVQLEALDAFNALAKHPDVDGEEAAGFARARDRQWGFVVSTYVDRHDVGFLELPATAPPAADGQRRRRFGRTGPTATAAPTAAKSHGWRDVSHEAAVLTALAVPGTDGLPSAQPLPFAVHG